MKLWRGTNKHEEQINKLFSLPPHSLSNAYNHTIARNLLDVVNVIILNFSLF